MFSCRRHGASAVNEIECSVLNSDTACKCKSQAIKQELSETDSTVLFVKKWRRIMRMEGGRTQIGGKEGGRESISNMLGGQPIRGGQPTIGGVPAGGQPDVDGGRELVDGGTRDA